MSILSMEEAQEATASYHEPYLDAHHGAWSKWTDGVRQIPETFKDFDAQTRFTMLNRHIVASIDETLGGMWLATGGPKILVHPIDDRLIVRFKALNGDNFQPQSYRTDQQHKLSRQIYTERIWGQLSLAGFAKPPMLLTCGYYLTPGEDELAQIVIVCHVPELRYVYDVSDGPVAEILTLPGSLPIAPRVVSALVEEQEADSATHGE